MSEMPERIWLDGRGRFRGVGVTVPLAVDDTEYTRSDLVPAWHDAPTCKGLWLEEWANGVVFVTRITIFQGSPMMVVGAGALEPIRDYPGLRWYGPIPEDKR